jgi:acyl dehydratase
MSQKTRRETLRFDHVNVGDELPELAVELTPTLIISTAIASRDYQDVHHDRDLAQQRGSKDIFMNILSTNGFVGRFVTDWAGPEARLEKVSIRLGAPNYAYDVMTMSGRVEELAPSPGEGRARIAVRGVNSLGDHVSGSVTVVLPL